MKEKFKIFVKSNPQLVSYVTNKKMTWQQFYEIYDLYGEDNDIWNNYREESNTSNSSNVNNSTSSNNTSNSNFGALKELVGLFKGIDLNTVQKTLTSLEKAVGTFREFNFSNKDSSRNESQEYNERPMYKYFED